MSRALIFANGDLGVVDQLIKALAVEAPIVVAADGGLRHVMTLGLKPDIVIGDMDSAPNELIQIAERRGAEIIRHERRKDQTDLELAVDVCVNRGVGEIYVFGALGGRLDHALANIFLMARRSLGASLRIVDEGYELAMFAAGTLELQGSIGDIVTLLPISETVSGITTTGLEYALGGDELMRGSSRGVSNVMLDETATVTSGRGVLLAIRIAGKPTPSTAGDL